jgi:hypothetical protein
MATQAKASIGNSLNTTDAKAKEQVQVPHLSGEQEIRDRAYEIYLQRGSQER